MVFVSPVFSDDFKELVRSRTDLVGLIGESVALSSRGREFVGLCPFHDDHKPSLRVNPERQSFKCWACQEGGDCFSFVMKRDRVEFREALALLAEKANLQMPAGQGGDAGDGNGRKGLLELLAWAETQLHECLLGHPTAGEAREYLAQRGISRETIARFRLGYHPNNSRWLLERAKERWPAEDFSRVGLGRVYEGGRGLTENFLDRVVFPIRDAQRRPVAFGGRILPSHPDPDAAKYWNGPETTVFVKSKLLYGLDIAREAVQLSKTVVVMEGYTDCILAQQHGVANAVATLGTSLGEAHVTTLKRLAQRVVLVYDGDRAGQDAAEKALSKLLAQETDLRILTLPAGQDPADFVRAQGGPAFQALVERSEEAWDFKFRRVTARNSLNTLDGRQRTLNEMLELVGQLPETASARVREDLMVARLAHRIGLGEPVVRQRLAEIRQPRKAKPAESTPSPAPPGTNPRGTKSARDTLIEQELLEIILACPHLVAEVRRQVSPEEIEHPLLGRLLQACYDLQDAGIDPSYVRLTVALEDSELKTLAAHLEEQRHIKEVSAELWQYTLSYLIARREASQEASVSPQPRTSESHATLDQDARQLLRLTTELNQKRVSKKTLA